MLCMCGFLHQSPSSCIENQMLMAYFVFSSRKHVEISVFQCHESSSLCFLHMPPLASDADE
jgi:hypothetical protein